MGGEGEKLEKEAQDFIDAAPPILQSLLTELLSPPGGNAVAAQPVVSKPHITLRPQRPWLYRVEGPSTLEEVELALYGADLTRFESTERVLDFETMEHQDLRQLYPDLLKEPYRGQFHAAMSALLESDLKTFKRELLDDCGRSTVDLYMGFWARRKEIKTPAGESYFDAFLGALQRDRWYTDYLLWNSTSHPYLDLVYSRGDAVEVHKLIGENSEKLGFYRPASVTISGGQPSVQASAAPLDKDYVKRASNMIMDRLAGPTWASESHTIVKLMTSLPPDVQVEVLQHFMKRYGMNETTAYIFSRSGEPTEGHMLFWLFEDLTDDDRKKLGDAFKQSGILKPEAVDQLIAGRTWAGRNLPWSTYHGSQAAQFWADKYQEGHTAAVVPGLFASLWTPETATSTIMTLTGARVFPVLGKAYPVLGEVLTVGGTGLAAFQGTLAAQSAITGRDVWTGEKLEFEERLGAVLMAVSNAIFVGVGIASGPKLQAARNARATAGLATFEPTPPRLEARLIHGNPKTGDYTIFIRDAVTGEIASIEGNAHAGHATVTNLTTGEVLGYVRPTSGFGPPAPGGALPAPSGGAAPPVVEVVPVEAPPDNASQLALPGRAASPTSTPIPAPPANLALSGPDPTLMGGPWTPPKSWNGPANHGRWMGVRGNSGWIDDRAEVIRIVGTAPSGDAKPIPFRKGVVDFGKWSQGELEVPGLTGEHATDMPLIRRAIADYKGLAQGGSPSAKEKAALDWLRDAPDGYGGKGLRPHHAGGNKIQLIPRDVHKVQHTDVAVYPEGTNEP